jgi:hypothetical protein
VIEIVTGLVVAIRPRFGGYLVRRLAGRIIISLLVLGDLRRRAARLGLLLGAVALARLATAYDQPRSADRHPRLSGAAGPGRQVGGSLRGWATVPELHTARLRLVPGTVELFDADPDEPERLAALLGITDLSDWPPSGSDYDRDAIEVFRSQLLADPALVGWNSYYACWGDALVGCGGYFGPPAAGAVEIGYAIGRPWRRQGRRQTRRGAGRVRAARVGERVVAHPAQTARPRSVLAGAASSRWRRTSPTTCARAAADLGSDGRAD